jgi:hypothetical protein
MRCPKCKVTLVDGGKRKYETLSEHVEDPNKEDYPLRDSYICPNQCFGKDSFFNYEGAIYDVKFPFPSNCFSALDSLDREIGIKVALDGLSQSWRYYTHSLKGMIIKGEHDIPSRWKWIGYWLKGKYAKILYKWEHRRNKQVLPGGVVVA